MLYFMSKLYLFSLKVSLDIIQLFKQTTKSHRIVTHVKFLFSRFEQLCLKSLKKDILWKKL